MLIIDGFQIDAALSEDHSFDNEVTQHPVEAGADITDHVRARPVTVVVEGVVTDTPIGEIATDTVRAQEGALPSDDAFTHLLRIRDDREPVTIETSLRTFENMLLQSITVPRSSRDGDSLRFRAEFVQVQLVTNVRTTVRVALPAAGKPSARKKETLGNQDSAFVPLKPGQKVTIDGQEATVVSATPGAGLGGPRSPEGSGRKLVASGRGTPVPPPGRTRTNAGRLRATRVPIVNGILQTSP